MVYACFNGGIKKKKRLYTQNSASKALLIGLFWIFMFALGVLVGVGSLHVQKKNFSFLTADEGKIDCLIFVRFPVLIISS